MAAVGIFTLSEEKNDKKKMLANIKKEELCLGMDHLSFPRLKPRWVTFPEEEMF